MFCGWKELWSKNILYNVIRVICTCLQIYNPAMPTEVVSLNGTQEVVYKGLGLKVWISVIASILEIHF